MKKWIKRNTPPSKIKTELKIECSTQGGNTGSWKLEAFKGDSLVHSKIYAWNRWYGHCYGQLLIDDFIKEAEDKC